MTIKMEELKFLVLIMQGTSESMALESSGMSAYDKCCLLIKLRDRLDELEFEDEICKRKEKKKKADKQPSFEHIHYLYNRIYEKQKSEKKG